MKHRNRHLFFLIILLSILGSVTFFYRWLYLQVPLTPVATTDSWTVEANLKFLAGSGPIKASMHIPNNPVNFFVLDENFVSHNYGVTTQRIHGDRIATWSIRRAHGRQNLYYRILIHQTKGQNNISIKANGSIDKPEFEGPQKQAVESLVQEIRSRSADIDTFVSETIKLLNTSTNSNTALLLNRKTDLKSITALAVKILAYANISARYVQGIFLKSHTRPEIMPWLLVFKNDQAIYYNPKTGEANLPREYLIWSHSEAPLINLKGARLLSFNLAANKNTINALQLAEERGAHADSKLIKFSLLSLPVQTQQVFKILLTIPIGALIILLLRHYVGLVTFGTFMPVLIALSFRETQLLWGCVLFSMIVSCGLLARFYLEQLQLLLVPRLSAVLTLVIILMVLISVLGQQLGLDRGLSVALFPMIILTMTIERMCILWEERGAAEAFKVGLGSLVAASIAYLAMQHSEVEYLLFAFPELLLVILALILLLGQYTGYRLSELIRFKALTDGRV